MGRHTVFLIGILLSAIFLYFAVRGARVDLMFVELAHANYWYAIPSVILTIFAFWLRAMRWRCLLSPMRVIPPGTVFSATMIGFFANNILPARLGELVRAHVVGRRAVISRSAALASILVERIFDLFTVLALFGVSALISDFPGGLEKVALIVLLIGLCTLALLWLWNRHPERFLGLLLRLLPGRFRAQGEELGGRFREGLRVFDRPAQLIEVGVYSIAMWAAIVLVIWCCILSLSIDVPQPQASLVGLVAIALVTMVPSAPGFIGTLQGGGTAALLVFGVPKELGLAFSIVFHATQWFPVNIVGLIYALREGLSLEKLGRMTAAEEKSAQP